MPHDPTQPGPPIYIPYQCGNCSEIPEDPPGPFCDCWAGGEDYMSFGWDPTPGCCYGCMDVDDWGYDNWATCHVQEACKNDEYGMDWSWYGEGTDGPFGSQIGCYEEDDPKDHSGLFGGLDSGVAGDPYLP
tara:strand:- start:1261 stop:1653 length:393 start_codon:yes stop_codon:yes gene_type:complete